MSGADVGVIGLVGLMGSGKTLRQVQLGLEALDRGEEVYANFLLGRREEGFIVPSCERFSGIARPGVRLGVVERVVCWGAGHEGHEGAVSWFRPLSSMDRTLVRWCAAAGFRRGRGFVADARSHLLRCWEQVVALREERDAFDVPHRMSLRFDGFGEGKDGERDQLWAAVPVCDHWRCRGCSAGTTVLIDELNLWAPSRFWAKMGIGVLNRWAYGRKDGLRIVWTAQHEARVDKVAREVTQYIYACRKIGGSFQLLGRGPIIRAMIFHRAKMVPTVTTDANRTAAQEGAAGGRLGGIAGWEVAFWPSLRRAAFAYQTFAHVEAEGSVGVGEESEGDAARSAVSPRLVTASEGRRGA